MNKDEFVCQLEPVTSVLRVFADGAIPGVDEYEFACTVVYQDAGTTAEFRGTTSRGLNFVHFRHAIFKALFSQGINKIIWERRKDGKTRTISIDLNAYCKRKNIEITDILR